MACSSAYSLKWSDAPCAAYAVLVRVDLEETEDGGLGRVLVGLVEEVARLLARGRGELLDGVEDDVLLARARRSRWR